MHKEGEALLEPCLRGADTKRQSQVKTLNSGNDKNVQVVEVIREEMDDYTRIGYPVGTSNVLLFSYRS